MPIPTYTFWCTKTYTGPCRSTAYSYTGIGYTATQTVFRSAISEEFVYSDTGTTVTNTYILPASTATWTLSSLGHTSIDERVDPDPDFYPYGRDPCIENTATGSWTIPVGVILGFYALGLVIAAILFIRRQKRRKAWYGPMAAHYKA